MELSRFACYLASVSLTLKLSQYLDELLMQLLMLILITSLFVNVPIIFYQSLEISLFLKPISTFLNFLLSSDLVDLQPKLMLSSTHRFPSVLLLIAMAKIEKHETSR